MKDDIIKRFETVNTFLPQLNEYLIYTQKKLKLDIQKKGPYDLVTEADINSEKMLKEVIERNFPEDHILSEESSSKEGVSQYRWIIDPIDGTTNYAHRLPMYGVCIGLENLESGKIELGVISFPSLYDKYHAIRGKGAFKNNEPIQTSSTNELINALVTTGFPYDKKNRIDSLIENLRKMILRARDVRRTGVASLDLCWVAEGRFDAYWEENLKPWDMAAGSIILEEAGGKVSTFDGNVFTPFVPNLLATNGPLHDRILELFDPVDPNDELEYRIKE
jgi:myo-inositol-1(or 4)-monophosphatase